MRRPARVLDDGRASERKEALGAIAEPATRRPDVGRLRHAELAGDPGQIVAVRVGAV